jgi:DNA-directed RNA polymerase specialized sigma24 family protein
MSYGSVTHLLNQLQAGDAAAVEPLWERYFRRLVALARERLRGARCGAADEEDVVLSVFESFCRHARAGAFPQLSDRNDLWRLLVVRTARKAVSLVRRERAQKRGGNGRADASDEELRQVLGDEPTPDFAAEVAEECRRLLGLLPDDLRQLALWKMEGHTLDEIALRLGCVPRTIKRRLQLIRSLWKQEDQS